MEDYEFENARYIMERIEEQRLEDSRLALIGYIFFLAVGFILGALLY